MDKYLDILMAEVELAEKESEVPVAAIIVKNDEIIAKAHNSRLNHKSVINHAEISAIIIAEKRIGDWRLNGCDMYVTLEPCEMCTHVIREARIDNVYYLVNRSKEKLQFYKTNICSINDKCSNEIISQYQKKLSDFFKLNGKR